MSKLGYARLPEASVKALEATTDMDMVSAGYLNTLEQSLKSGKVTMTMIDNACRKVLEAKYKLGLFSDPYIATWLHLKRKYSQKSTVWRHVR